MKVTALLRFDRMTLDTVASEFLAWAEAYYRRADGSPTLEAGNCEIALRMLRARNGRAPIDDITYDDILSAREDLKDNVRVIVMGPKAQAQLQPYLTDKTDAPVFSPPLASRERGLKGARRDRKVWTANNYGKAIRYAIRQARKASYTVADWTPNQLRLREMLLHMRISPEELGICVAGRPADRPDLAEARRTRARAGGRAPAYNTESHSWW